MSETMSSWSGMRKYLEHEVLIIKPRLPVIGTVPTVGSLFV